MKKKKFKVVVEVLSWLWMPWYVGPEGYPYHAVTNIPLLHVVDGGHSYAMVKDWQERKR